MNSKRVNKSVNQSRQIFITIYFLHKLKLPDLSVLLLKKLSMIKFIEFLIQYNYLFH